VLRVRIFENASEIRIMKCKKSLKISLRPKSKHFILMESGILCKLEANTLNKINRLLHTRVAYV